MNVFTGVTGSGSSHTIGGEYHPSPTSSPLPLTLSNHNPISQSSTMPHLHHSSFAPTTSYASSGVQHQVTFANPVTAALSNNIGQISGTLAGIQSSLPGLQSNLSNNVMGLTGQIGSGATYSNVQSTLTSGLGATLSGLSSGLTSNLTNPLSGITGNPSNLTGLSSNLNYNQGTYTNPLLGSALTGTNAMNIKLKPLEEMELSAGRYTGRAGTPATPHHQPWSLEAVGGHYGLDGLNSGFGHTQTRSLSRIVPGLTSLSGLTAGQLDLDSEYF